MVTDYYLWIEVLRLIRSDGLQPEIALHIYSPTKRNVPSADDAATGSKVQTWSPEQKAHDRARHPIPTSTSNQQQRNSRRIRFKSSGNSAPNLVHCRVAFGGTLSQW